MNVIETLLSRRSVPALKMSGPGPSASQIELAVDAALRAPDHGAMRPWRFVLVQEQARSHLSQLLVRRMQQRQPPSSAGKIDKARDMVLAAPLVIAVGARILADDKIPEIEQLLSTGAGVMNLLNAFHAQGFGAIWLTGPNAYDPEVASALGFGADERLLGFVYVGTPISTEAGAPKRADREAHLRHWSG